jgi:hypothetical protein
MGHISTIFYNKGFISLYTKFKLMKKFILVFIVMLFAFWHNASAVNITIVESHYSNIQYSMDLYWLGIAHSMGYNAVIDSQSVLDDTAFFSRTDILIVSDGTIPLNNNRLQNVIDFVKDGHPAYIQAEWWDTLQGDKTFLAVMGAVGSNFKWTGYWYGEINDMKIGGEFATTPYVTDSISYFYFGQYGTGSDIDSFLFFNHHSYGFFYHPSSEPYRVISVSDEDWINMVKDTLLMKNILYQLVLNANSNTGIKNINYSNMVNIYPNPNSGSFNIEKPEITGVKWNLCDLLGRQLSAGVLSSAEKSILDFSFLPEGNYILNLYSPEMNVSKKITVLK